jgi:hypothetical protein
LPTTTLARSVTCTAGFATSFSPFDRASPGRRNLALRSAIHARPRQAALPIPKGRFPAGPAGIRKMRHHAIVTGVPVRERRGAHVAVERTPQRINGLSYIGVRHPVTAHVGSIDWPPLPDLQSQVLSQKQFGRLFVLYAAENVLPGLGNRGRPLGRRLFGGAGGGVPRLILAAGPFAFMAA